MICIIMGWVNMCHVVFSYIVMSHGIVEFLSISQLYPVSYYVEIMLETVNTCLYYTL